MSRRGNGRLIALLFVLMGLIGIQLAGSAKAATGAPVKMYGYQWFGGAGVPVCASSTETTCDGQVHIGGVSYNWWQCVELAQRFYQRKGWYPGIFPGVANASDIYVKASSLGMSRQGNGSVTTVVPGDMLVMNRAGKPGHVAIVDSVTTNSDGSKTINTINQNAIVVRNPARWHGGIIDSFWADYSVAGIVHDPDNRNNSTSGGGTATYEDVSNGGGTRLVTPNAYLDVSSIGQVYAWNNAYYGGQPAGNTGIVDVAMAPNDRGYWMIDSVGHVYAYPTGPGGNPYFGGSPVSNGGRFVAIAARPDGNGYWLLNESGQVFAYPTGTGGNPYFGGSPAGYSGKFVDIHATPTGNGYWLLTSAGQIYAYGDAKWYGNATGFQRAIVAMSSTPSGQGYVLVSVTGQVYAFGDAQWIANGSNLVGDVADISYTLPGMAPGYLMITKSGAHYAYGAAPFIGNPSGFTGTF